MRKLASYAIVVLAVLLNAAVPSYAGEHDGGHGGGQHRDGQHGDGQHHKGGHRDFDRGHHGHVFIGGGPSFYFGPAYSPYYASEPAPVYASPTSSYWSFCRSAGAYYPTITTCAEPWLPVPATP